MCACAGTRRQLVGDSSPYHVGPGNQAQVIIRFGGIFTHGAILPPGPVSQFSIVTLFTIRRLEVFANIIIIVCK